MEQYHGTNTNNATNLASGFVDVTQGGGELGQGFYTGDLMHEAFNWAWHQYQRDKAVVQFTIPDAGFLALNVYCPDIHATQRYRGLIRANGETRTYLFHKDAIWAPVVGKHFSNFNQIKFESKRSENFINGGTVTKTVI